jgi:hypothetical protein
VGSQFDPDLARQFIEVMSRPLTRKEIQKLDADLAARQPPLSQQRFQELLRSINHRVMFRKDDQKSLSLFHN